ncbi:MAG: ethanolamine utilization protein EutN/carboxysome structural protein Ccml [Ignavibacteria bacterium]|nr:MAG: ethanolamine utilization protein EutN/carboxysome structural protein Ccml [Ignavibacteria bacterium]KAF0159876.1 MAG: ethanolamine utilization protein EutN/carboxysome structural protein Ccml [Ignavibacteria bacterium]
MFLAKVIGNVVSTQKNRHLVGHKLLIVHPISERGRLLSKKDVITLDLVDSGVGDVVIVVQEGDAVQQMLGHSEAPVNTMIIAVVDDIEIFD